MSKIMIIEDDPAIVIGLKEALTQVGYEILAYSDGEDGYQAAKKEEADLILLDIMLPNRNGLEILKSLRIEGIETPILMLTSKKEEIDKIIGFEFGADDYVTKPFSVLELQARIKALLRRSFSEKPNEDCYEFDDIKVECKKMDAFQFGKPLNLTVKEFNLLKFLIDREGEAVSRDILLDNIWGYDNYPTTRTVDNYILSLRRKIEKEPSNPKHILTIPTIGYKFLK